MSKLLNRELWLMRHGKAQRFDGIEDYDRPLKKKGKKAAREIAGWLSANLLQPDVIISSPATRAYTTAKIVSTAIGLEIERIIQDKRLYDEGLVRLKAVLADCPETHRKVLVIGHNPELEALLVNLLEPSHLPHTEKLIPTAALIRLRMPDDWIQLKPNCAELLSIITPKNLLKDDSEE